MKIETIKTGIEVNVEKSKQPIIFLDSNLIIEFNKLLKNKSNDKRIEKLFDLIKIGANEFSIQCPVAEQEMEVGYGKNHSDNIDLLFHLCNGCRFKNSLQIESIERMIFLDAFMKNKTQIMIDYQTFFDKIDVKRKTSNIYIKEVARLFIDDISTKIRDQKIQLEQALNDYKNHLPKELFKEHLFKEFMAESMQLDKIVDKLNNKGPLTNFQKDIVEIFIELYKKFDMTYDEKMINFLKFTSGIYWFEIPYIYIHRNLHSYKVVIEQKYEQGDFFDINNASLYFPFCNFYYTDNKMAKILKELGLDVKYNTKVYCYKNIDDLIVELEKLLHISK